MFLNADLARIGEARTIEDENQEHRNIKDILKEQGQQWPCLFIGVACRYLLYILNRKAIFRGCDIDNNH